MLCKYNAKGPLTIGEPIKYDPKSNNKSAVITNLKVVLPGVNTIPDEFWEKTKDNPAIAQMMKVDDEGRKVFQVLVEKTHTPELLKKAKELGAAIELAGMDEVESTKTVGFTINKEVLDRWMAEETRSMVRLAIANQLDKLKLKKKSKND